MLFNKGKNKNYSIYGTYFWTKIIIITIMFLIVGISFVLLMKKTNKMASIEINQKELKKTNDEKIEEDSSNWFVKFLKEQTEEISKRNLEYEKRFNEEYPEIVNRQIKYFEKKFPSETNKYKRQNELLDYFKRENEKMLKEAKKKQTEILLQLKRIKREEKVLETRNERLKKMRYEIEYMRPVYEANKEKLDAYLKLFSDSIKKQYNETKWNERVFAFLLGIFSSILAFLIVGVFKRMKIKKQNQNN